MRLSARNVIKPVLSSSKRRKTFMISSFEFRSPCE
jgi:hypothetical protein